MVISHCFLPSETKQATTCRAHREGPMESSESSSLSPAHQAPPRARARSCKHNTLAAAAAAERGTELQAGSRSSLLRPFGLCMPACPCEACAAPREGWGDTERERERRALPPPVPRHGIPPRGAPHRCGKAPIPAFVIQRLYIRYKAYLPSTAKPTARDSGVHKTALSLRGVRRRPCTQKRRAAISTAWTLSPFCLPPALPASRSG